MEQETTLLTIENISQLKTNVQATITADLENYYTKNEVDQQVSTIPKFSIEVVETLPTENISDTTLYLVPATTQGPDVYTEYIHVNDQWEELGVQTVDLSDYYTKTEADAAFAAKDDITLTNEEQTRLKYAQTQSSLVTDVLSSSLNNPSTATQAALGLKSVMLNSGSMATNTRNLPMASTTQAGCMTVADKTRLDNTLHFYYSQLGTGEFEDVITLTNHSQKLFDVSLPDASSGVIHRNALVMFSIGVIVSTIPTSATAIIVILKSEPSTSMASATIFLPAGITAGTYLLTATASGNINTNANSPSVTMVRSAGDGVLQARLNTQQGITIYTVD